MTVRTQWSDLACPIARALDTLGDPWALLILREVFVGNRRYDGIKDELGIADTVLSKRLRTLVEAGLLSRVPYGGAVRPRVEYMLTAAGRDTLPVLHSLASWGRCHTNAPDPARTLSVECVRCGEKTPTADWCPTCAAPLDFSHTGWRRARNPEALIRLATA